MLAIACIRGFGKDTSCQDAGHRLADTEAAQKLLPQEVWPRDLAKRFEAGLAKRLAKRFAKRVARTAKGSQEAAKRQPRGSQEAAKRQPKVQIPDPVVGFRVIKYTIVTS